MRVSIGFLKRCPCIWLRESGGDHFCASHQIVADAGDVVMAMAQNRAWPLGNQYDQMYLHVFKIRDGQIQALIEGLIRRWQTTRYGMDAIR